MAGATLSTLSNLLKNFYLGPVQTQFNNEILINQLLGVSSENLEGLQAVLPLHTSRTSGVGSRGELETLPIAGSQGYSQATFDLAYHYGRAQVSGQAIAKTKSSAGAFLQAMQSELDGLKDDLSYDFVRQLYGAGDGNIATLAVNTSTATLTLGSNEAIVKGFLYINMKVDIGTTANPQSIVAGATITDVDPSVPSITIDSSVTTTTSNIVYRQGNAGPSTTFALREMPAGLQKILSTSANTVGGINGASAGSKYWQNIADTTGGAVSLSQLMQNWNKAYSAGAKQGNVVGITTPGLTRRLFETADFKALVQFVNTNEFTGGFTEISFAANGTPVKLYPDRLAPYGKVLIVDKPHIRLFSPMDWSFLDKDGLSVRWVADLDAFQVAMFRYASLGVDRRNTSVSISGLTDTGY